VKVGIVVPFSWSVWGAVTEHAELQGEASSFASDLPGYRSVMTPETGVLVPPADAAALNGARVPVAPLERLEPVPA
jgi:hypothetical protein